MENLAKNRSYYEFFKKVTPVKLTEGRQVKLHQECWGLLSDFHLESVKINSGRNGALISSAVIKVADRSGQITGVVKGHTTGLLFGLSSRDWANIEKLCDGGEQLFYRYFKDGLSKSFGCEQKMFYYFCLTNQNTDILVAVFRRAINTRNKDKNDALLHILQLFKCDSFILDLYLEHFKNKETSGI